MLHYFRKHEEFIMLLIDKKIVPCVMNRKENLKQCIKQNLLDASTYERISIDVAYKCTKKT